MPAKDWLADERALLESLGGRTIESCAFTDDTDSIVVLLDDDRIIRFSGVWHNDQTAGCSVEVESP